MAMCPLAELRYQRLAELALQVRRRPECWKSNSASGPVLRSFCMRHEGLGSPVPVLVDLPGGATAVMGTWSWLANRPSPFLDAACWDCPLRNPTLHHSPHPRRHW
jgi:hypothetical protein